jgi:hypothetical protein
MTRVVGAGALARALPPMSRIAATPAAAVRRVLDPPIVRSVCISRLLSSLDTVYWCSLYARGVSPPSPKRYTASGPPLAAIVPIDRA